MTHSQQMLDTLRLDGSVDTARLATAIDMLLDCASTCTQCADACMTESSMTDLTRCIALDLDCADMCTTMARVLARRTVTDFDVARPLLDACIAMCGACATECEGHADHMEHCRICAEQCRRCEEACRMLVESML